MEGGDALHLVFEEERHRDWHAMRMPEPASEPRTCPGLQRFYDIDLGELRLASIGARPLSFGHRDSSKNPRAWYEASRRPQGTRRVGQPLATLEPDAVWVVAGRASGSSAIPKKFW